MASRMFTDQVGRIVEVPYPVKRIVSLVPSQTELLHHLGLDDEVVGITKFCVHPESWHRQKTRVGGTKKFHIDTIARLEPDLIIGNKEENQKEQIEALEQHYAVWLSDVNDLDGAYNMITSVGELTDKLSPAKELVASLKEQFHSLPDFRGRSVAYFIWQKPYMVAANDTFINHMLKRIGLKNAFAGHSRYPEIDEAQLKEAGPELIFLSSEPYPFKERHIEQFRQLCPDAEVLVVDGELFSWYGSRLLGFKEYTQQLLQKLND